MTRVSVVIPCYNHARFLPQAIESALAQDRPVHEVVVVDDGSTDGSGRVAAGYGVTLVSQANAGLSRARNAGLARTSGEIVIFLDADDRLRPAAARLAVETFVAHPEAAMVYGRCQLIDADGAPLLTNIPVILERHYEELLRRNYIWMPAMAAFRRTTLDHVGPFDPTVNPSADYDLYLRIARQASIISHDAIVADYRQHGANMSGDPVLMLDATLAVLAAQRVHVEGDPRLRAALEDGIRDWRAFYGEHLVERFRAALHARRLASAAHDAVHLLRLYPAGVRFHLAKKARLLREARQASRNERR